MPGPTQSRFPSPSNEEFLTESQGGSGTPTPPRRSRTVPRRGTAHPFRNSGPYRRIYIPAGGSHGFDGQHPQTFAAGRGERSQRSSTTAGSRSRNRSSPLQRRTARAGNPRPDEKGRPGTSAPARQRSFSPVEFDPVEPKCGTEDEDDEEPPPQRRRERKSYSESGRDEIVVTDRSHPPVTARQRVGAPIEFDPIRPDPSVDGMDEELPQALVASLAETQLASTDMDADFEEQFRAAMNASKLEAEEHIRRIIATSQREHEEEERQKARRGREFAPQQEQTLQEVLEASQRAALELGIEEDQDELARVISLSEAAYAEDVRRWAEQMALERTTSPQTASWTETNYPNRHRGPSKVALRPVTPTAPREESPKPAIPKPTRSQSQSTRDNSPPSQNRSTKGRPKPKPSPLNPNRRTVVASSSSSAPAARYRTTATEPSNAVPPADQAASSSQALIVRPPPIDPSALIALCEKAFPEDADMSAALAASRRTASISTVQNSAMEYDPLLAATITESLASAAPPANNEEVALAEPPPSYFSIDEGRHRIINHFKYTTADYRRERPAGRIPVTPPILNIMRLWREFLAWEAECGPVDTKGRRKASPFAPLPPLFSSSSSANSYNDPKCKHPHSPPPLLDDDKHETDTLLLLRPTLRSDIAISRPSEQTQRFMAAGLRPGTLAAARSMQARSQAIGRSRLAGWRPRREPEAHMRAFAGLPIVREGVEEEKVVVRDGGGRDRRGRGVRRSGI